MKRTFVIIFLILCSGFIAACAPKDFVYKRSPHEFAVLAAGKNKNVSMNRAVNAAQIECTRHGGLPRLVNVQYTENGLDQVNTIDHYFYVIQDTPSTDYFTTLKFECVLPPPPQTNQNSWLVIQKKS